MAAVTAHHAHCYCSRCCGMFCGAQVSGNPLARNQTAVLRALLLPSHSNVHGLFGGGRAAGSSRLIDGLVHGASADDVRERPVSATIVQSITT
jgi:hypothetical protein